MKQVIDRKVYDTEKATLIHAWDNGCYGRDFRSELEELYRTSKGVYFIYGAGGPRSKYAVSCGNDTTGSCDIWPVTREEAVEWLEEHDGAEAILEEFPDMVVEA